MPPTKGPRPPRWLTKVPAADARRGDGKDIAEFIETYCTVTQDTFAGPAGTPMVLRPWQRKLLDGIFARRPDSRRRHRVALVGMPRKQGKSGLSAGIALDGLFAVRGAEVYSCAADRDQARIVFTHARRMVEGNPALSARCTLYRDVIELKETGSIYRSLSAEAYTKEGLSPTLVIFDEVHAQPNDELWNVMALASGARIDPLLLGITTAGVRTDSTGQDSICYRLFQYGQRIAAGEVTDPSFFMAWWGTADENPHDDPKVWAEANPAYGDLLDPEEMASAVGRTPENEFRTKRLNQWVSSAQAWLPSGAWDRCLDPRPVPDLAQVVLAFDGSFNNDSTALVVAQAGPVPHLDVVRLWERPPNADPSWTVPVIEVEDEIRQACRRWQVREIACDPHRWARSYQILEDERLPIVEFPQSPARMTPATQRFYEAVMNRSVTHSGDPQLARHLNNAVLKVDSRGQRIVKETKNSPRKIDLAVAAVMALDRVSFAAPAYDIFQSVF
jgi:phage terminase large subunit-like protein